MLAVILASPTFKPAGLEKGPPRTPLVVFELSDRTAWQEDSEVVSQKATQMLVGALFRRGLCFQNWEKEEQRDMLIN